MRTNDHNGEAITVGCGTKIPFRISDWVQILFSGSPMGSYPFNRILQA